jgi:hypothetical protein
MSIIFAIKGNIKQAWSYLKQTLNQLDLHGRVPLPILNVMIYLNLKTGNKPINAR